MTRYTKDDVRMMNAARKFRAGAALCVFGLVGAVWLQAELVAADMYGSTGSATTTPASTDTTSGPMPDAENPSATLAF